MKKMFCAAALSTVMGLAASQSAMADQAGNVHFTGTVTSNTCVLSGQDITHDLGAFNTNDSWAKTKYGVLRSIKDVISVSGCPAGISSVAMTPTFVQDPNDNSGVKNDGDATHVNLSLNASAAGNTAPWLSPNNTITFPLTNGGVDIPLWQTYQHDKTATQAGAGSMEFNATFAFAYN